MSRRCMTGGTGMGACLSVHEGHACTWGTQVAELAKGAGAMKTAEVAVSGGFHTPLMQPARNALVKVSAALGSASCDATQVPIGAWCCRPAVPVCGKSLAEGHSLATTAPGLGAYGWSALTSQHFIDRMYISACLLPCMSNTEHVHACARRCWPA